MKTLYLPLKKEWYEMIERGEKPEEYRAIVTYWMTRLLDCFPMFNMPTDDGRCLEEGVNRCTGCTAAMGPRFKEFNAVCFSYGYTRRRMTFECKGITIGRGRPEWGAPEHTTFIIKLGKRL